MFRTTKIKKGSSKSRIITTKNGFVFSTSVGGSLTGEGADYIIIDDPNNPTYIYSEKIRNKTIDWYEKTLSSRLNDRETGSIVIVMQRLHTDDLCGYLERKNDFFKILKIPIITKENIEYKTHKNSYSFLAGSVMDKRRFPSNIVEQIRTEMGADNFAAQYMQMPNKKNGIIDIEFLALEDFSKISVFDFIVQSWDTAIKTSDESDYSVCTTWGIFDDRYYLVDLFREKVTYPDLKKEVQNLTNKYKPKYLIIEDKASGQQLIQDLKCSYIYNIIEQKSIVDKITRVCINLDVFRNKSVVLPKNKPWVELVIKELKKDLKKMILEKDYENAIKLEPNNPFTLNNYAYYLSLRKNQLERAKKMSRKTLDIAPDNGSFLDTYAWICFQLGQYQEALLYQEKAVEIEKEDKKTIYEHYGDILSKVGNIEKAVVYWQKSMDAGNSNKVLKQKITEKKYIESNE
jgi:predicted phage terminase large subunit-like protein